MAMFWFIGATIIAVFAFLSVAIWSGIRADERKTIERYALLRRLAEQPAESARLVLEQLREEDQQARERRAVRASKRRLEGIQAGVVLMAVAVGLMVMLETIGDQKGLWTVGLIPGLIGIAVAAFAWFQRSGDGRGGSQSFDGSPSGPAGR